MVKPRILIVEDEPDIREILKFNLGALPVVIDEAFDGFEARQMILQGVTYSLILSDLNMPRMTGFDLLQWLRDHGDSTPFIILTAYGDPATRAKSESLGALSLLTKPWSEEELLPMVEQALKIESHFGQIGPIVNNPPEASGQAGLQQKKKNSES